MTADQPMKLPSPRPPAFRWVVSTAIWLATFLAAVAADGPVASWVRASGTATAVRGRWWAEVIKVPGDFWFSAAVVAALWLLRRIDWRAAVFVFAAAAFAGLNVVVKWVVGRTRPFKLPLPLADQPRPLALHPFWHGVHGLFNQHDLSFPSGHECTALALAAAVWVVWRPGAWPLIALAAVVGVERVAENAHYASDVIGAVGFAAAGVAVAWTALSHWMKPASPPGPAVVSVAEGTTAPAGFDLGPAGS